MEIRELRVFVAVVEYGGLSAAARKLHLSQSAVSQTIQSLERQAGTALLVRSATGAQATPAGERLAEGARALIGQHDRLLAEVAGQDRPGVLNLGVPLELPADVLPAAMARLATTHPTLRLRIRHASSAAQLGELRSGELDVALMRFCPPGDQYDAFLVVEEAMGVILSTTRSDELAEPHGVQLHKLASLDWITFPRSDGPIWYDQVTATLRTHGIQVGEPADGPPITSEVKLASVGTGTTFALAAEAWAQPLPEELVWQPLVGDPIVRRTWAVWEATSTSRDVAALIGALT